MGLEEAVNLRIKILDVYGDSALVINQIKGEWETRHPGLIPYKDYARRLLTFFNKVEFHHIPRDENQMADALATLSSMYKVNFHNEEPQITIRRLDRPAHVFAVEEETDEKPWYFDIKHFLQTQEYPLGASNKDKKTLRRLVGSFFINADVLYKGNYDMVLLRCVDRHEADMLMHEIHEGSFGTHANGHSMAKKMLRASYYWLTMESDCYKFVKKCHECQVYADKIHVPPTLLNVISSPWPFSMWGIDMIGMIEPKASNGHRFILVAIDYFTKWVKAASYANVTKQVVVRFIKNNIICRYGVPSKIITVFTVISGKQPLVFQTIINMIWLHAGSTRLILGHIVKKIVINVHLNHIHDLSSSISVVRLKTNNLDNHFVICNCDFNEKISNITYET